MAGAIATLITEMRRRRVFRVIAAYAVVAFVLLQVAEITFDPLELPDWSLRALIVIVVLGLPIAVVLGWAFQITPEGIRRETTEGASLVMGTVLISGLVVLDAMLGYYLYRVYAPGVLEPPAEVQPLAAMADFRPPAGSIAVLPFDDFSEAGDQQYFADGIAEELLNLLARVNGLKVQARTSSFALRGQHRDAREIGQLLNVAWVLEGSVRKGRDRVRVTAQLINTADGFHEWSQTYDRGLEDTIAIQDEIAGAIVAEITGSTDGLAAALDQRQRIIDFDAYNFYLQGRQAWQRRTPADLDRSIALFQQTVDQDPAFAPAYSGMADAYLLLTNYGNLSATDAVMKAEPLIDTALKLDGQSSEAFASLGLMHWILGRFSQAEGYLRQAVKLDPNNVTAATWLGGLIGEQGRLGEQRAVLQRALELDPINQLVNINIAGNDLQRGEFDAGIARLERQLQIFPDSTLLLRTLAASNVEYGHYSEAHGYLSRAMAMASDEPVTLALMGHLLLRAEALDAAREQIDQALAIGPNNKEVEDARARYLLVAGRADELTAYAVGKLEDIGGAAGSNAYSLRPYFWLGMANLLRGDYAAALDFFEATLAREEILPPWTAIEALTWSAAAHAVLGHDDVARDRLDRANRIVERLHVQHVTDPKLAYLEACIDALRGDAGAALEKLEVALAVGWVSAWEAENDPRLASLNAEERFRALVEDLRLRSAEQLAAVNPGAVASRAMVQ